MALVTPEGDTYCWHGELGIIAPIASITPEVHERMIQAYRELTALCKNRDLSATNTELFLDPTEAVMEYYFIDNTNRHPFWAWPVLTHELGLSAFETQGFLSTYYTSSMRFSALAPSAKLAHAF